MVDARVSDLSQRTVKAAQDALAGRRRGLAALLPFVGPAVIASVAYMDPGNFATNIQAGASYGYELLWIVVAANLLAMLFQHLAVRLGIASSRSLAQVCRDELPRPLVIAMWVASEIGAMATDLAEFLGGAIGLSLLFGLPLLAGLALTAIITYAILLLQKRGFRPLELAIGALVLLISVAYLLELLLAPTDWPAFLHGSVVPTIRDSGAVLLAVGIIGATVMPHAIYLHSGLVQGRVPLRDVSAQRGALHFANVELVIALGLAGLINMAMLAMAAAVFHAGGRSDVASIETAYRTLTPLLGGMSAVVFLISLLASGLSSSAVGTLAGQMIMNDFLHIRLPLWLRRLVTMAPAFIVAGLGYGATQSLIISQVVLSLVLPVPMLALVWFTGRRRIMGEFAVSRILMLVSVVAVMVVLALNTLLLLDTAGVVLPWS